MQTYQFFVTDDRYTVPTLKLNMAPNRAGAREEAERLLAESRHHVSVAVYLNAAPLFEVGPLTIEVSCAISDPPLGSPSPA